MKGQCFLPALVVALTIHLSWCLKDKGYYTKRFAVQVDGGNDVASFVAESHGMKNLGLVSVRMHATI